LVDIEKNNPDMDATSERSDRSEPDAVPAPDTSRPLPLADDRYEALVRQMPDALYIVADDIIVFINEAGVRLFGAQSARDIVGHELEAFVHDNSVQLARQRREWMVAHGAGLPPVEQTLLRCDGTPVDVEVLSAPVQLGWRTAIQVVARDISQRKQAEQALRESEANYRALAAETARAKELLRCEKTVLELSSRNVPLPDLLAEVCRLVETLLGDGAICSVLLSSDGEHITQAVAPSLPYLLSQALIGIRLGSAVGSCGTAMFLNKCVIVEDIDTDPLWDGYRELVAPLGLRACWSTPIRGDNAQMMGAMGIYYDTPRTPTRDAMGLLDGITDIVGVAIQKAHIARELLESAGYVVSGEAADAAEALAAVAADSPDAVLLDVQLPDRDGFTVASAITAADGPAVVLISSREADDYGLRVTACGARGFISKSKLSAATFAALLE